MTRIFRPGFLIIACMALAACNATQKRTGSAERDLDMLGGIKALEGTWTMLDENGAEIVGTVYKTTAAGSAVQEVMFPGTEHEMVNLYHMDGSDLVVTHYCAAGNQPRMVASEARTGPQGERIYRFDFDRVSNLRPEHQYYMGNLTLTIKGDHLTQTWTSLDRKGGSAGTVEFEMTRR
ncbi:MAG: hypothetical protein D6695_09815 [Planctomycetota bacterium]|nr:MAG: hypothetical protein D6695_09815 [Planctomycetota bacterium]